MIPVVIGKAKTLASAPVRVKGEATSFLDVIKAITPQQQSDALDALARKYEGRVQRKLLEAFRTIRSSTKMAELAALIERRAPDSEIFSALGLDATMAHLGSALDDINQVAREGGILTVTQAAAGIGGFPKIQVYFDQNSPAMVDYLRTQAANLVTSITQDVQNNIRQTLADMVYSAQGTPMSAARDLRDSVGLTARQKTALDNYRYYLENGDARAFARSIGGNAERIITAGFRDKTMTADKINKLVESYRQRLLQSRAQIIAQTETFRAANVGANQAWKQISLMDDVGASAMRRYWVSTNDSHTRDSHREIPYLNENGVGLDEPFDSPLGPIMYPGDPDAPPANSINCRCRVVVRYVNTPQGFLPPMTAGRSILPEGSR